MNRREFFNRASRTGLIAGGGLSVLSAGGAAVWISTQEVKDMASLIEVDKAKCRHCRQCQYDCLAKILVEREDGTPMMVEGGAERCYHCQHCMTICPSGALSYRDKKPEESLLPGMIPEPALMQNLLRQRRSTRAYKEKNVEPEIFRKIKETMNYVPTGCNDHALCFSYSEDRKITDRFRTAASTTVLKMIKTDSLPKKIVHFKRLEKGLAAGKDIFFRTAPHFVAISVAESAKDWYIDPYIAATQFELLAVSYRLGTCWGGMATDLFSAIPELEMYLHIPPGYRLAIFILFGYPNVQYSRVPQPEPYQTISLQFN